MRDVKSADTRTRILGFDDGVTFFIAPTAMQGMVNPDREKAVAKGAGEENVSTNSSHLIVDIVSSGKGPGKHTHFLRLYVNTDRQKTSQLLANVKACGLRAVFVTVETHVSGKREADKRLKVDPPVKSVVGSAISQNDRKGGGMGRLMGLFIDQSLNWEDIPWIESAAGGLLIVLKGVQTAADAKLAAKYGVQGIVLSNHGGRNLDTSPPALFTLLKIHKIYPEVFNSLETEEFEEGQIYSRHCVLVLQRSGSIGRTCACSITGQKALQIFPRVLKDELETTMRMCGVTDLSEVHLLNARKIDALLEDRIEHL
ncbi:unnamed protein product [Tuber aestivum]|uniref:FMN hydroxy acid dehydrogenase domain-containing protein n=1 Tax=Tuber aestivum TaxID=59557 RepID=A0A292PY87_9PEZI|nr:unnamed protein product [Tuber aestivum]